MKKQKGKKKSPPKKEKDLGEKDASEMTLGELRAALAAKEMARRLSISEQENPEAEDSDLDEDTENMSDEEEELETIEYEGVEYLMDPKTKVVSDPSTMERVGVWDNDGEEIEFDSEELFEQHCEERDA